MPKRTWTGEPVPSFGQQHVGIQRPARLKLDIEIPPPDGSGSRPNVVATVQSLQPVTAAYDGMGRATGKARPQELSLTLKLRVVLGNGSGAHHQSDEYGAAYEVLPTSASTCSVLEAIWSDAEISQVLRRKASPAIGLPLLQRIGAGHVPAGAEEIDGPRKRFKKYHQRRQRTVRPDIMHGPLAQPPRAFAGFSSTRSLAEHTSPTPSPLPPPREIVVKPVATKVMGSGKSGAWTATTFRPPRWVTKPIKQFAPGKHASLPCVNVAFLTTEDENGSDALDTGTAGPDAGANIGSDKGRETLLQASWPYANTLILVVDGSCAKMSETETGPFQNATTDDSGFDPPAGWAFAYKPGHEGIVSGVVGQRGADGQRYRATRHRADLRAVLAALEHRDWARRDGVDRIVLATASHFVAKGLTAWLRDWAGRQWHTEQGGPLRNRDLWQRVSDAMGRYARAGCEVSVWHVPRAKLGTKIEAAARRAAREGDRRPLDAWAEDEYLVGSTGPEGMRTPQQFLY